MSYSIEHVTESREAFASYRYNVFKDGKKVAIFWHDFRGECEGIKVLLTGYEEDPPFGLCSGFITGGGPLPLELTEKAKIYLDVILSRSPKN